LARTVDDSGRCVRLGATRAWPALGGPFDEEAAAIANAAVGNPPNTPLLECVLVGPKLRLMKRSVFCDGDLTLRDASDVGRIEGMRGYLAIEGGVEEMPTILRKGDTLWSAAA